MLGLSDRGALWGVDGELDFWTAHSRSQVVAPEVRAVSLLQRMCDPDRFGLYCQTGQLPVLGNLTKKTYLVLRSGGVLELDGGRPVAWWCFSIGPFAMEVPPTDHVVVIRAIIEGEELAFMRTADRHEGRQDEREINRLAWITDPFIQPFAPVSEAARKIGTHELLDELDLRPLLSKGMLLGRPFHGVLEAHLPEDENGWALGAASQPR